MPSLASKRVTHNPSFERTSREKLREAAQLEEAAKMMRVSEGVVYELVNTRRLLSTTVATATVILA